MRRLEEVGVPSEQAEAQAKVLTEAFNVNLEELVTNDYLAVEFAKERAHTDVQFAEIKGNFRTLYWMNGLIILVTVVPVLQRFFSF